MHKFNEGQANPSPYHDEFQVNLMLLIHNLTVDALREYHKFVGLELDDEKLVGFIGMVRGDFDHTPYQEHKCPKCGQIFPDLSIGFCTNCKEIVNPDEWELACNDRCPVCHPKKYSLTNAVKSCRNCHHFDVSGETETPFSDGKTPESLPDEPIDRYQDFYCHGNQSDMRPCEYWGLSIIKCPACGTEHIGLPDWCGICGEKLAMEV